MEPEPVLELVPEQDLSTAVAVPMLPLLPAPVLPPLLPLPPVLLLLPAPALLLLPPPVPALLPLPVHLCYSFVSNILQFSLFNASIIRDAP